MLKYKAIEIFTSEQAHSGTKPTVEAVVDYIRSLKIAARCMVTRAIAGCYETGEVATGRIEVLSFNMPVKIYIVLPAAEIDRVLNGLNGLVEEGIVMVHDLHVLQHHIKNAFFPRQLLVRDVMTQKPVSVRGGSPLSDAAKLLLSSIFTGLPVVDEHHRPIGVVTQGDLIERGGMPIRLGLLAELGQNRIETALEMLAAKTVAEAMTVPAVTIAGDHPLTEAVDRMLTKEVKRLPVVDGSGQLVGMLSRSDIFRAVMREAPDWNAFKAQKIRVDALKRVGDILRRDTHTVSPETPVETVIQIIDQNDIQRVAVVDDNGKLMGLISDRDLLRCFKQEEPILWRLFSRIKLPLKKDSSHTPPISRLTGTTARMVMNAHPVTVNEQMLIEEAISLMIEKRVKRLPVVDDAGCFKGMISRDSLLRTGFGRSSCSAGCA